MAVAYSILLFQQQPEGMPVSSYIWDVNNPNTPDFELKAASQLCCCNYNPKDPNIISGGAPPHSLAPLTPSPRTAQKPPPGKPPAPRPPRANLPFLP